MSDCTSACPPYSHVHPFEGQSRPVENCQYCTPTTGGHAPFCPTRWRSRAERAEAENTALRLVNETFSARCALVESLLAKAEARLAELEREQVSLKVLLNGIEVLNTAYVVQLEALRAEVVELKKERDSAAASWWRGMT